MATNSQPTIRRARRDDIGVIVAMLADDPLGSARERLEDPLPAREGKIALPATPGLGVDPLS